MQPGPSTSPHDPGPAPTSGPVFVSPPRGAPPHRGPDHSGKSRRRLRKRLAAIAVGLVAVLCVAVIAGLIQAGRAPGWWPGPSFAPGDGPALGNSVITQLYLSREGDPAGPAGGPWRSEPWRVSMRAADVNAWLEEELPRWLMNRSPPVRWPGTVGEARVRFGPGEVTIGVEVKLGGRSHIITAALVPEIREDGSLWLTARRVGVGRLPGPASWIVPRLKETLAAAGLSERLGDAAGFVIGVLEGSRPLAQEAVIRLEDGRRVRILDLEPRDGALWITARTEGR